MTTRRSDGVLSTVGVARAPASGFRIALAAPAGQFTAPLRAPLIWALVAGVAITAAGLLLALLLAPGSTAACGGWAPSAASRPARHWPASASARSTRRRVAAPGGGNAGCGAGGDAGTRGQLPRRLRSAGPGHGPGRCRNRHAAAGEPAIWRDHRPDGSGTGRRHQPVHPGGPRGGRCREPRGPAAGRRLQHRRQLPAAGRDRSLGPAQRRADPRPGGAAAPAWWRCWRISPPSAAPSSARAY